MKILLGSGSQPDVGSGIRSYVNALCGSLLDLGHEVHYASPPPALGDWPADLDLPHLLTEPEAAPSIAVKQILEYCRTVGIEGVINNDNAFVQSAFPALDCPGVSVGHSPEANTIIASLACYQHEWSDYVITISDDMRRGYNRRFGIPVSRLPLVYNGVPDPGDPDLDSHREPGRLSAVFGGGWQKRKGARLLYESIRKNPDDWKKIDLIWLGNVPDRVKEMPAFSAVDFLGHVPQSRVCELLASSDILLFPSYAEGCPMMVLEAMSVGALPIVSDGEGAMNHMVVNGVSGYVCPLGDWGREALACIRAVAKDRDALNAQRIAVRQRYLNEFQAVYTAERIVDLLESPQVDRRSPPSKIALLNWQRPLISNGRRLPLVTRLRIKAGILSKSRQSLQLSQ